MRGCAASASTRVSSIALPAIGHIAWNVTACRACRCRPDESGLWCGIACGAALALPGGQHHHVRKCGKRISALPERVSECLGEQTELLSARAPLRHTKRSGARGIGRERRRDHYWYESRMPASIAIFRQHRPPRPLSTICTSVWSEVPSSGRARRSRAVASAAHESLRQ